eukprot:TRINITY_DN924_c0_g2_i1.p2 TRINITY_DN924_c0_g2~~TRINITY_DN924_c0_g2_i1.p2  ORF type:complete len:133 (-),score=32.76 TRINITY_DN924_c0_g2_i1:28-426(-)
MVNNRYVEIGRVALINYGPDAGKLCVIVDLLNQSFALVDGPAPVTGVKRQLYNFKRLTLTPLVVPISRGQREGGLVKAFQEADIINKFNASRWGKVLAARAKRASTNDFERFKASVSRRRIGAAIRHAKKTA